MMLPVKVKAEPLDEFEESNEEITFPDVQEFCIVKLEVDSVKDLDRYDLELIKNANVLLVSKQGDETPSSGSKAVRKTPVKKEQPNVKIEDCRNYIKFSNSAEECIIDVCESEGIACNQVYKRLSHRDIWKPTTKFKPPIQFEGEVIIYLGSQFEKFNQKRGDKPMLLCPDCDYSTRNSDHLKRHYLRHTGELPYSCPFCDYRSRHKGGLDYHIKRHTGEKNFKCPFCSYACIRKINLRDHIRIHTGIKPFVCHLCSYRGTRKSDLKNHMSYHTGEKKYSCSECSYTAGRQSDMYKHIQYKHREKSFFCKRCSYSCVQKGDLEKHMIVHTGIKNILCPYCDYRTGRKSDLNKHLKIHTDDRPHKCSLCTYASRHAGDLDKHMQTHTGLKKYGCEICNFRSVQRSDVFKHMKVHNSDSKSYRTFIPRKRTRSRYQHFSDVPQDSIKTEVRTEGEIVEIHPMDQDDIHVVM